VINWIALAKLLGALLMVYGLVLLVPAAFSWLDRDQHTDIFLACSLGCLATGGLVYLLLRKRGQELNARTGFALVTFAWVFSSLVGALPYLLSATLPSVVDAVFESMSGFTGTGASVISDVESVDRGILLWRSLTQWLGSMGIIVFFVALLPALGFSGVQLFKAEVAGPQKDRLTPRVKETAQKLWVIYLVFTVVCGLALYQAGMPWFDALNHALTTIATGGFSTKNSGIAAFDSAAIDYCLSIGMLLGSISFGLHYRVVVLRDPKALTDTELRWFGALLILAVSVTFSALVGNRLFGPEEALRHSVFQVVSIATSTGFSHQDFTLWPPLTQLMLVLLMVMGGMSGSTSGGIKCIRLVAAFKQLSRQLIQVVHPKAVIPVKANQHVIPEPIIDAIWGLLFMYFLVFSITAGVLTTQGLDLVTASTASFSALSNIGPGLGAVGPAANYAALTDISKLTLTLCMLLGRLEFFTVLVLFTPAFWRK
jgi:trk system potassium uptake protein TrkH